MAERLLNISRIFCHCQSHPINRVAHLWIRYGTASESEYLTVDSVGHRVCNAIADWEGWLSRRNEDWISAHVLGVLFQRGVFCCVGAQKRKSLEGLGAGGGEVSYLIDLSHCLNSFQSHPSFLLLIQKCHLLPGLTHWARTWTRLWTSGKYHRKSGPWPITHGTSRGNFCGRGFGSK